jgi:hypothetical protein
MPASTFGGTINRAAQLEVRNPGFETKSWVQNHAKSWGAYPFEVFGFFQNPEDQTRRPG